MASSSSQQSSSMNPATDSTMSSRQRQRTSAVWEHYNIVEVAGVEKAVCKACQKTLSCKSSAGTGHLRRHAETHAPTEARQSRLQTESSTGGLGIFHFTQEGARNAIARWLLKEELPFFLCSTSRPAWSEMVQSGLQPDYLPVSRQTIVNDCLKIFNEYRGVLFNTLKNVPSKISLTSDIWTSILNVSYMCITAHWIDSKWNFQKRIISFREISTPHTSTIISTNIQNVCEEYQIINKVFTISFDNASSNVKSIRLLKANLPVPFGGKLFHVKCSCHILNLCVQDGLKVLSQYLIKIKTAITHVRGIANAFDFKQYCEMYNKPYKRFPIDIQHRWNYTYRMLESCLDYSSIITEFFNSRVGFEEEEHMLTEYDWAVAHAVRDFLKVFNNATTRLSGCYYSTTNIFLKEILEIALCFSEYRKLAFFANICDEMETKFLKYWETIPLLNLVASVLDPRFKDQGTFVILEKYIDVMQLNNKVNLEEEKQKINNFINEMYTEYEPLYGNKSQTVSNETESTTHKSSSKIWNILLNKKSKSSSSSSSSSNQESNIFSEINFYYRTDFTSHLSEDDIEDFNVLDFWNTNQKTWPVLAAMARDILTPPMSTVPSECTFSASGRVLVDKRSRLTSDHLEMCVLLKDWLDAENKDKTRMAQQFTDDYELEQLDNEIEQTMLSLQ